jgi:hypothetical protein
MRTRLSARLPVLTPELENSTLELQRGGLIEKLTIPPTLTRDHDLPAM